MHEVCEPSDEKSCWLAKRHPGMPIGIFRKMAASLAASTERTLLVDVLPRAAISRSHVIHHWYELGATAYPQAVFNVQSS